MVIGTIGIVSCSSTSTPKPEFLMNSISMYATADSNNNSALAVDLVIVYNFNLLATLNQMSACTYFASVKQLLLDNPTLLDVWHWELIPGQTVQNFQPPQDKGEGFGAFVFANYLTPGDHRLRVPPDGVVNILLMKDDLKSLTALEGTDLRLGKTMTDPACCWGEAEAKIKQGPITSGCGRPATVRMGPTTIAPPCKVVTCQRLTPGKMPLSIVARPLPPLKKRPPTNCLPCNPKRQ